MQSVQIVEVAPRDGLQNEAVTLATAEKAELVGLLAGSGVRRIEVTSFVNPARVPQLADAEELCGLLPRGEVSWIGLVLNERGLDRAIRAGLDEVNVVVVATDTFSQRNQGLSTDGAIAAWTRIAARARAAGLRTTVTIAASFGCPFEGEVAPERVADVLARCVQAQPDEVALADTIGVGVPAGVRALALPQHQEHGLCLLRWGDVRENTLHIQRAVSYGEEKATKTNASRTVRLLDPLRRDLAEWRLASGRPADSALVFPSASGTTWT